MPIPGVGICPRCTVIPVKAADEALVRPDRLAQSLYFSVDSGASVVVAVVAELGYTRLVERALQYAWDKGVVAVMASNDFNSADHQSGMF
jgi:subtilisin family serine protease